MKASIEQARADTERWITEHPLHQGEEPPTEDQHG